MKRALIVTVLVGCTAKKEPGAELENMPEPRAQQAPRSETRSEDKKPGYLGVLTSRDLAEVIAPFTSTIDKLEVKLGDQVQQGQRLARFDERSLKEQLSIERAALKAKQATASEAQFASKGATATLERERKAQGEGVTSPAEVAAAEVEQRKAQMAAQRASANVDEQRARIAQLEARLKDTSLLAPIAGKVALLYVREGDRVEEGRPVIRVISGGELYVKFAIPADKVGTLAPGDKVDIVVAQQGVTTRGVVRHVAPEIDPIAKMILADAELEEPNGKLQAGIDCRIVPRPK